MNEDQMMDGGPGMPFADIQVPTSSESLYAQLLVFVRLVAETYWVTGEMYEQCFFCDEIDNEHMPTCPVLAAQALLKRLDTSCRDVTQ